jgi:hypothetical protein
MFNITLEHMNRIGLSMSLKCENMTKLNRLATYSKPNKTVHLDVSRMYLEYLFTSHMFPKFCKSKIGVHLLDNFSLLI